MPWISMIKRIFNVSLSVLVCGFTIFAGQTALFNAFLHNNWPNVEYLLTIGADTTIRNYKNKTIRGIWTDSVHRWFTDDIVEIEGTFWEQLAKLSDVMHSDDAQFVKEKSQWGTTLCRVGKLL